MPFFEAVLTLAGMIIGVGMFAIPFAFSRAGFWLGAGEFVILGAVVVAIHLLYGDIVMRGPERHRLPGYAHLYLGAPAAAIAWGAVLFGMIGSLLAYLIVGAVFLHTLLAGAVPIGSDVFWVAAFTALGIAIVLLPFRKEALINGILTAVLIAFILALSFFLLPRVSMANFDGVHLPEAFAPYGILLFALTGGAAVPEVVALLGGRRSAVRRAIVVGSLIPVAIYFLFSYAVVGALGSGVSEEAIRGLGAIAGERVVWFGSMIGLLAIITSFVVLTSSLESLFEFDWGLGHRPARLVAIGAPIALYLAGFQNFIAIIGAVGALGVGVDTVLIVATHRAMQKHMKMPQYVAAHIIEGVICFIAIIGVAAYLYQMFVRM